MFQSCGCMFYRHIGVACDLGGYLQSARLYSHLKKTVDQGRSVVKIKNVLQKNIVFSKISEYLQQSSQGTGEISCQEFIFYPLQLGQWRFPDLRSRKHLTPKTLKFS